MYRDRQDNIGFSLRLIVDPTPKLIVLVKVLGRGGFDYLGGRLKAVQKLGSLGATSQSVRGRILLFLQFWNLILGRSPDNVDDAGKSVG